MRCKCGFENAVDARFCGQCRSQLTVPAGAKGISAVADSPVSTGATPAPTPQRRSVISRRVAIALSITVILVAAPTYWVLNRPAKPYKRDNSGLFRISSNGKVGFMDRTGNMVVAPQFDDAADFSEGRAAVRVGKKIGFVDTKGTITITPQFDPDQQGLDAYVFRYGRATVRVGDRYGVIDEQGRYIRPPNLRFAGHFSDDFANIITEDNQTAYLDRSGNIAITGGFDGSGPFTEGRAPASTKGQWGFIDLRGKWLIEPQFEGAGNFADGLAPVVISGKFGYINATGKFTINPQYQGAREFSDGYAPVRSDRGWSFVDREGRVVGNTWFESVGPFSEGLAPVKTAQGWGYIDTKGRLAITPSFDAAGAFQNGLGRVRIGHRDTYVTATGGFAVDPYPGRAHILERPERPMDVQFQPDAPILSVSSSPDGRLFAAGRKDTTVSVWSLKSGGLAYELSRVPQGRYQWQTGITSLAFSRDGGTLAAGGEDGVITLWDIKTGKQARTLTGHSDPVNTLAFGGDRLLASGSGASTDYTVRLWDVSTGSQLMVGNLGGIVSDVAFSDDGAFLAASAWEKVHVLQTSDRQEVAAIDAGSQHIPAGAAIFTDAGELFVSGGDRRMHAFSIRTKTEMWTADRGGWDGGPPIAWCGSHEAVGAFVNTSNEPFTIQFWQPPRNEPVERLRLQPKDTTQVMRLALSGDCRYAAVVHQESNVVELLPVPQRRRN